MCNTVECELWATMSRMHSDVFSISVHIACLVIQWTCAPHVRFTASWHDNDQVVKGNIQIIILWMHFIRAITNYYFTTHYFIMLWIDVEQLHRLLYIQIRYPQTKNLTSHIMTSFAYFLHKCHRQISDACNRYAYACGCQSQRIPIYHFHIWTETMSDKGNMCNAQLNWRRYKSIIFLGLDDATCR